MTGTTQDARGIWSSLEESEQEYLQAVFHHQCGPATEEEMAASETLFSHNLIYDSTTSGQRVTPLGRTVIDCAEKEDDTMADSPSNKTADASPPTVHSLVSRLLDDGWTPTMLGEALEALQDKTPPTSLTTEEYAALLADKLVRGVGNNEQRAMTAGLLMAVSLHRLAEDATNPEKS